MKSSRIVLTFGSLALLQSVSGQDYINLNFEQATIAPTPVAGWTYPADPAQLFPGWTVGGAGTVVGYNDLSIGAPAVDLMGPNFPNFAGYTPLQGSYSVLFEYFGSASPSPSLSQTGLVPLAAQCIHCLVSSGTSPTAAVVTLNGVSIPLISVSGGRLAGDISTYAGSIAQLTLSTPSSGGWLYFDDIRFSSSQIPEPSIFSLFGLSILFLLWLRTGGPGGGRWSLGGHTRQR